MIKVAPSLLAADFMHLGNSVGGAESAGADWLHYDVMDGHFVPNISMGPGIAQAISKFSNLPLDIHLMIEQPERLLDMFLGVKPAAVSVHVEASYHLHRVLQQVKAAGALAGLAFNPGTAWQTALPLLPLVDYVLLMTVNPGFGGQPFIAEMLPKVAELRTWFSEHGLSTPIQVDGGVTLQNAGDLVQAGANILVAGSSFYRADDQVGFVRQVKSLSK